MHSTIKCAVCRCRQKGRADTKCENEKSVIFAAIWRVYLYVLAVVVKTVVAVIIGFVIVIAADDYD